jgi:hypothetical protein
MYHQKITDKFGPDLYALLGPKENRRPWHSLSESEKESRLKRIPEYINTRSLGKHPSFVDMVIFSFTKLANMGNDNPLLGIELPQYDSLQQAAQQQNMPAMNYDPTNLKDVTVFYKNAAKQRDIFLRHIFEDIVLRFNPGLVFPGIGRMDSRGRLFINDAQHRILACMFLGIEQVPVSYINSDNEYWDVSQYAAINIHSLSASPFDHYRIRVQRAIASEEAGIDVEAEDDLCLELHKLFDDLEITVCEKGDNQGTNSKVLTGIGNMIKYRKTYGSNYFERATTINAQLFPSCIFHTANSWGLMEFFKYQDNSIDKHTFDFELKSALRKRWPKDIQGGKLHKEIKDAYKKQTDADAYNSRIPEELIIAHGIWQVCKNYAPNFDWREPTWPVNAMMFKLPMV